MQNQTNNSLNSYSQSLQLPLTQNQYTIYESRQSYSCQQCPTIEVSEIKVNQNTFPFGLTTLFTQNNSPIVQGIPVNQMQDMTQAVSKNLSKYSDNLRLQKYESEKKLDLYLVSFTKYNKIGIALLIILLVSYIVQIQLQNSGKQKKDPYDNSQTEVVYEENYLNSNIYYFIVEYLFWFFALILSFRQKIKYSMKNTNVYLCIVVFSFIFQLVGFADLVLINKKKNQTVLMAVNIAACIIEFVYKSYFCLIKAYYLRVLFEKHFSQFKGLQTQLLNNQQIFNRV